MRKPSRSARNALLALIGLLLGAWLGWELLAPETPPEPNPPAATRRGTR